MSFSAYCVLREQALEQFERTWMPGALCLIFFFASIILETLEFRTPEAGVAQRLY